MKLRKLHITIASLLFMAVTYSCSGTKNLTKASLDVPESAVGFQNDTLSVADMRWWEFYSDSTLCKLIARALDHNRDILVAAARVEEIQQLYGVEKLNYLPTLNAIVGMTRETNDYRDESFSGDTEISVKATVAWEANLWGSLSYSRRRAAANYMASVEDCRAMQMTVSANVAETYFRLVALENELNIVKMTLATRREALAKAKLRFEGGLTSETVYSQAQVEYASTAAYVPELERRISTQRNALSVLVGAFPGENFDLSTSILDEKLPDFVNTGLPSQLLKRRPDIRAAENRLQAAVADCGLSYAERFPSLRLSLTGGWENSHVAGLFESPFSYILGNITGTVLDFGRRKRRYKAKVAAYDQSRYAYENCVINAFREVGDAVVAYDKYRATAALQSSLRDAALKYVELANVQYLAGTLNYIDVLDAQRHYFDARVSLSNAVRDQYLALIEIYKSLGGGW